MSLRPACTTSALAVAAAAAVAAPAMAETAFHRVATFPTTANMAEGEDRARESAAEIVAASEDGMTLAYTDGPLGAVGLIDLTDPAAPKPLGNVPVEGEPTSVVWVGGRVFAAVNTSESHASPSGRLVTIDPATRSVTGSCDLGGQPDSVARARDGSFLAIAVENERDEEVADGALPQSPPGFVVRLPLRDAAADCAGLQRIDLTGLAEVAPEDPEPEYLDVNEAGEIVVTLQENNHVVVIGADGAVAAHFPAGTVDVSATDTRRDGRLSFDGTRPAVPREPDAVKWIDTDHFMLANEGDYEGGSRGWTVMRRDGRIIHESGTELERAIAAIGHYPEGRSAAKGVEPETVEFAVFDGTPMGFVATERASVVAVYDLGDPAAPVLRQLLPSGISPEGMVAIPGRGLLVTANEVDLRAEGLAGAHVMVYSLGEGAPRYPTLTSEGSDPLIGWGALSGLAADPERPGILHAVTDSAYPAEAAILTIDTGATPARITARTVVTRGGVPAQKLDLEGIATDGAGGFWLASEGRSDRLVPHALYHVDAAGEILEEVALPEALLDHETRFGLEGIARAGGVLWLAVQREWQDDPPGMVKLLAYDTEARTWGAVHYPLETPAEGAWMGLSELALSGDWLYVIERDNQVAERAAVKRIYRVPVAELKPAELGGPLPVVSKSLHRDLIPDLAQWSGYVAEKVEGLAIDATGTGFVVTDNDGVSDNSGETFLWTIGPLE